VVGCPAFFTRVVDLPLGWSAVAFPAALSHVDAFEMLAVVRARVMGGAGRHAGNAVRVWLLILIDVAPTPATVTFRTVAGRRFFRALR
jgi:hypothetical protein